MWMIAEIDRGDVTSETPADTAPYPFAKDFTGHHRKLDRANVSANMQSRRACFGLGYDARGYRT